MEPSGGYTPLMTSMFPQIPMTTEAFMDCTQVSGGYSSLSVISIAPFVSRIVCPLDSLPVTLPVLGPGDPEETLSPRS